jgi:hypothetical protein
VNKLLFLAVGFGIWMGATVALRFVGQYLLVPGQFALSLLVYAATIPFIAVLAYPLYRWRRLDAAQRPAAAALMCLPGMVLDTDTVFFIRHIFPNLSPAAGHLLGSWLLRAYALALVTAFLPVDRWIKPSPRLASQSAV